MRRFHQRIALVTGAGSGIGAAIALRLAQEGASVVVADRHRPSAAGVAETIESQGFFASPIGLDLTSNDALRSAVECVGERHDHVDVLVNNACIPCCAGMEDDDTAHWRHLMASNAEGMLGLSLAMLPLLNAAARPGAIVNLMSISGMGGGLGHPAYTRSKDAVTRLTRSMALDLAKFRIRVNAVCPSSVLSPVFEGAMAVSDAEKVDEAMTTSHPARRTEYSAKVASVVAFLASGDASFVNGVNWQCTGD